MSNKVNERKEKFLNDCSWLFKKSIYHRGCYNNQDVFENTMEAYKLAIEKKAAIELDVQLTSDLQVICFHDTYLKRFFNREREVKDISYKRLNKIRVDFQIPLFKDVLKLVDGKTELVIELKSTNAKYNKILVQKVNEILKEYNGKYVIVSFNPIMLNKFKRVNKDVYIGRNGTSKTANLLEKLIIDKNWFNWWLKPDFISYDIDNFNEEYLKNLKEKQYKIIGWTLKDKERKKSLKKYFDNFIIEE